MESFKGAIIVLLLTFGLLTPAAQAKSPNLLLQQGLYAEQTEGNLEKAINLYEQVLEESKQVKRLAARATYQLGMCYLKKGDKEKAAEYFQETINYYPEQKTLVKRAVEQLGRLPAGALGGMKLLDIETRNDIDKYEKIFAGYFKSETRYELAGVAEKALIVQQWIKEATGDNFKTRVRAIAGLGNAKAAEGVDTLIKIAEEPMRNNRPKWMAVRGLWNIGDPRAVPTLIGLVDHGNANVRVYARLSLAKITGVYFKDDKDKWKTWWIENRKKFAIKDASRAMLTQEMHNTIDPNGLIHFKSPNRISNNHSKPMTTNGFINSDFVMLTKIYEDNGTAIPFETTHEGNIYRYKITFNKPIMPGESMMYYTEGTTRGLINPVPGKEDVFRYYMVHSPSAGQPVLRIETYLLPEDAVFISTATANIQKTEKDGRIELRVEEVVPTNGSITTEFQYKLAGASEPLKLGPAPWVDGEVMEVRLKRPAAGEYGTIIYSAQSNTVDDEDTWQIVSHMYVTEGSISQYTFVEAQAESFAPVYGQTTNWMGDFVAKYNDGNVNLAVDVGGQESTRDVPVQGIAYDNEQALYLIRRMPLAENYEGSFPIFTVQGGVVIECRIKVLGTEDITVEAGRFTCYKTDLSIYMAEVRTLQHTLWFSADEHKYLVMYDVGGTATMVLAKVWHRDKDAPLTFENEEPPFSVAVPADWRYYSYASDGPQFSLQLMPPQAKAWAVLVWQKRGDDPDSDSAMTIARADCENLKGFFENYRPDESSWKEFEINNLEAAQYFATYQQKGTGRIKYDKPKQMVEYRTYIVYESNVYWFVFRTDQAKFEQSRAEFDKIITSFDLDLEAINARKLEAEDLASEGWRLWKQKKLGEAEAKFKQATEMDSTNSKAYQGLGWAQFNQDKKLNAKDSFEKCVAIDPKNSAALNGLGWIAHGQGNTDKAIQWWKKGIEAQPGATAAISGLTKVYMEKKEFDNAMKYYQMWLKVEPDNKQAREGLKKAKASNRN